jgi:hypothetical protein
MSEKTATICHLATQNAKLSQENAKIKAELENPGNSRGIKQARLKPIHELAGGKRPEKREECCSH